MPPKPPPKQITSLSQIDITKLDVKDLQNINYEKLLKDVRQRPDTAISFAAPIIAIFFAFNTFTKFQGEQKQLSTKIREMNEKVAEVQAMNTAQSEFDAFLKTIPVKISENEFINKITDLAVKNNIRIESFTPGQNKADPLYELISLSLLCNSTDFNNLGHFIEDIENSGLAIRVNRWSATMGGARNNQVSTRNNANINMPVIIFRMDIAAINFKL